MNSKAFEILRSFSKEDVRSFKNYVHSPFFKVRENTARLYELLIQNHPDFNSKLLADEILYKKIYPGKLFNASTLRNLFSELNEELENYLIQLSLTRMKVNSNDLLRMELLKRNLAKQMGQNINKTTEILQKENGFEENTLVDYYHLVTDHINHISINKPRNSTGYFETIANMHSDRGRYLTYLFVKEMVRGYDNLLTLDKTFRIDKEKNFVFKMFDNFDFIELLNFLSKDEDDKTGAAIFEVYHALMIAFSRPENDQHYFRYKNLFEKNIKKFGRNEIRFHTIRFIRYCMMKCSDVRYAKKYEKELFDVHKMIIEKEYYRSDFTDFLPVELFRTAMNQGLKLKDFKWTIEFINKHKNKLNPEWRKNIYHFSCAKYYFHTGKYRDSMKHFHKVQLNHFMFKIDLKNLMLKTYYEMKDYESALSLIDTYKHFLAKDTTLSQAEKKRNKNFICTLQKMIEYKTSSNPLLKYDIEKFMNSDMADMDWIEEKMEELEKQYYKSA